MKQRIMRLGQFVAVITLPFVLSGCAEIMFGDSYSPGLIETILFCS